VTTVEVPRPDQRTQVHERTLRGPEHRGMRVDSDAGRRILRDAGTLVDEATPSVDRGPLTPKRLRVTQGL
jgi:trimethylamine:corrinoid methyltransferase-like protein